MSLSNETIEFCVQLIEEEIRAAQTAVDDGYPEQQQDVDKARQHLQNMINAWDPNQ